MKIGVISDTHDNLDAVKSVVELLNEEGVEYVFHAGDIISPFTVDVLGKLKCSVTAVYGNNDGEKKHLKTKFDSKGFRLDGRFAEQTLDGKKIAVFHGDIPQFVSALINCKTYQAVFFGHTHQVYCKKINGVLALNPGEVCGYLSGEKTFAIVDLSTMTAEVKKL